MTTIAPSSSTSNLQSSQAVTTASEATVKGANANFDAILKESLLGSSSATNTSRKVSEEDLFAALIQERLATTKGDAAAATFAERFKAQGLSMQTLNGYTPVEKAAKSALTSMVKDGSITADEGNTVYSQAFAGAQLDTHKNVLWDGVGSAADPTMAVDTVVQAISRAKEAIAAFASGTTKVNALTLSKSVSGTTVNATGAADKVTTVTATGRKIDGADGFLFKPISQNERKLAVLLPESMAYNIDKVILRDAEGKAVERGRFTSYGDTGTRAKYVFSKQGGSYPKDISIEVHGLDGKVTKYQIPDPSKRYD